MGLLPEINEERTINNVKSFFNGEYERLCRLAGGGITISSPQLDGMPRAQAKSNPTEAKFIKVANYHLLVKTVAKAINACSPVSRVILLGRFIQGKSAWQVAQEIGYESSHFYDYYNRACLEFADTLEYHTKLLKDDDLVEDLHSYKNDDT
ncbi:ArpU family phage packaging/lysis transcriptional regulator [Limosilactobacillus antri]|uniref:ArpU family phage packaging/lysis transcriptional regulator n=1 Tax=Limosilactobacillus antri TaxID=227943 RepID=UPI001F5AD9B9|nr:ArpU family phage packaging/lysis transcriptional regulator [Limosilactobacillus antri]